MESSRDSSVWRALAIAFGDGLAFGAGLHLTRRAARRAVDKSIPADFHPRVTGIQPATESPIQSATEAHLEPAANFNTMLALIDGRFREFGGQIDRRLAELHDGVYNELDARDRSRAADAEGRVNSVRTEISGLLAQQRHTASDDLRTLRGQMITVQKEFAEALSRLVDDQISRTVHDRLQPLEERLHQSIREDLRAATEAAASAAQQAFDAKDRQLADLRDHVAEHDRTVLALVVSLGQSCLQASDRISIPVNARQAPDPPAPSGELPGSGTGRDSQFNR
jgi:hypothetical protein